MALNATDWIVIAAYLLLNLLISLYYRRRSSGSTEEFFVSGRNVSWWLAGTSMVATTFAADTPLFVTGVVAKNGISGNWIWWSQCLSGMMTVFFFARYWRRAGILTDVEFVELRYEGKPAAFLRGFRAIYLGGLMNCLILGWVIKAMISITTVLLGDAIAQGRVLEIGIGGHTFFRYTLGEPAHTGLLDLRAAAGALHGNLHVHWRALGRAGYRPVPVHFEDVDDHRAGVGGGFEDWRNDPVEAAAFACGRSGAANGAADGIGDGVLSVVSSGMDDRRDLDAAGDHVRAVSGSAVVGELVSGSGARAAADTWRSACSAPKTRRIRWARRCGSTSRTTRCARGRGS